MFAAVRWRTYTAGFGLGHGQLPLLEKRRALQNERKVGA
jgi:hypothetical protein